MLTLAPQCDIFAEVNVDVLTQHRGVGVELVDRTGGRALVVEQFLTEVSRSVEASLQEQRIGEGRVVDDDVHERQRFDLGE